jgi:outer membrane protein OmpA-like peptidoglycan-associated protein/tetratricopeptide (TPR) repeat protein
MMKITRLLPILLLSVSITVSGQYTKEFKRIFFDAEYLYLTGFYQEAFNRYKNLLTLDPGNSNILFLCGACCLNIPGNEQMAITYLEEALPGVTQDYKEKAHKEPGAPVLTYFMLGKACHLNSEFDKAIRNYGQYVDAGFDEDPLQIEYARLQIEACRRAAQLVDKPPSFEFTSVLDQFDDDLPSCSKPVVSGDGNTLIFLVDYPSDKKIMMTSRTGGTWSRPRVINSEIGMVGETYPACLSYDGYHLYLVHHFYSHSDIFVSHLEGGRWSEAVALGPNINGRTDETHASISKDGKTLYFTSDTRGSLGSYDIFVSKLDRKGEWGTPSNLGPVINTHFEEHTPFISGNDSILFFSSQGHATIGGIDVFYSDLGPDGSWGEPVSLGYPVNTTGDDLFFNPGWGDMSGFYAVRRKDDPTSNTINMVIELEPAGEVAAVARPMTEGMAASDQQKRPASVEEVIEPEVTGEILEVLNKGSETGADAGPVKPVAGSTRLQTSVPFDHNACELNLAAMLEVEKIAELMQAYPEATIRLTGHADATGSSDYNLLLSCQRVDQIARYLEMRGIDPGRILTEGRGEASPVARNTYPDGTDAPLGRYLNRQVTVLVVSPEPIQADLTGIYVPADLRPVPGEEPADSSSGGFTIQLCASHSPVKISTFQGFEGIREHKCRDGFCRYTYGTYQTFGEARAELAKLSHSGYADAFIQTLEWYRKATE